MLSDYPKAIITKDGTRVLLRPLRDDDEDGLNDFFSRIPENERWFLRDKVSDPEVIHQWIENLDYAHVLPMVAVRESDGSIIANLSLHCRPFGGFSHLGVLRMLVDPAYRAQRLGTWMLLDMIRLAMEKGLEKLVAEFISDIETAAMNAALKLDFFKVAVIPEYVKASNGHHHDLIVMIKTLHREWSDF
jgi:L-amino acid N-acyltransferase YncA